MLFTSRWLRFGLWIALSLFSSLLFIYPPFFESRLIWLPLVLLCFFNAYIEFIVSALFISPGRPKPSLQSDEWESHILTKNSQSIHLQVYNQSDTAPLIVFIHGWRGSSASVFDRAQWFIEKGWHVAIFELPGHGMSSPLSRWNAISASKEIQYHLGMFNEIIDSHKVSDFFLYGHSMGGYLCTRISKNPEMIPFGLPIRGIILESPLLLYSNILLEISDELRIPMFLRPLHLKRVFRDVKLMHPEIQESDGLEQFDIPAWGLPSSPTLCLQAMNDSRLGRDHYDAAVCHFTENPNFSHHLIESLTHAGARRNKDREDILLKWLKQFDSLLLK
tara:strand:- start:17204 stop:18202 length:999 start_codon:yes stop_codon:yes gene_type:complete